MREVFGEILRFPIAILIAIAVGMDYGQDSR